jgi:hypothetical protein
MIKNLLKITNLGIRHTRWYRKLQPGSKREQPKSYQKSTKEKTITARKRRTGAEKQHQKQQGKNQRRGNPING